MDLSNIEHGLASLVRNFRAEPSLLIAVLASACTITFIIAIVTDALGVNRKTSQPRKPSEPRRFDELDSETAPDSN
jgi:hypothetical protein